MLIRYFLSVKNFTNKFSSSNCCRVSHIFFVDLRMSLGLLEYFNLLSSCMMQILFDFSYSVFQELWRKFWGIFHPAAYRFSFVGLISGLKLSLLYKFSFLTYFSLKILVFSWVVKFLENIPAFSLKQDLVYCHQSLAEERLLDPPASVGRVL